MRSPSPDRTDSQMNERRRRSDLSSRGDAAVMRGVMQRTREGDLIVRETPDRRSFWFGHGYELAARPTAPSLAELARIGCERFGAIPGTQRFVILDEHASGAYALNDPLPPNTTAQRDRVMRFEPTVSRRTEWETTPVEGAADWATIGALLAADASPEIADFQAWAVGVWERAATAGFARFVAVRSGGEIRGYAGLFASPDASLARFCTPVTEPAYRGRGIFSACANALIGAAVRDGARDIVICAEPTSANEHLYGGLGFRVAADIDSYIVKLD